MTDSGPFSDINEMRAIRDHVAQVQRHIDADNRMRIEALRLAVSLVKHIEEDQTTVTGIAERYYQFLKTGVAPR